MEKNQLIELIKQNRIGDALKLVEKAVEGTDLQNEVILLSSTYSEYAKLNRSATEDFNTLEMQRNRIVNRLLSFLDDLPADALKQIPTPPPAPQTPDSRRAFTPHQAAPQAAFSAPAQPVGSEGAPVWKKYGLYIVGGLVGLVILIGLMGGDPEEAPAGESAVMEQSDASVTNPDDAGTEETAVKGYDVEWFEVVAPGGTDVVEINMIDDVNWEEVVSDTDTKNFVLTNRDEWSVYLRDDSRGVSLHLNLYDLTVTYNDANGQHFKLYDIQNAGVYSE